MTDTPEQKVFFRRTGAGIVLGAAKLAGMHRLETMALDPKATPEERFKAWLAEQVPIPVRPPRLRHPRLPLQICIAVLVVGLSLWVVLLSSLSAKVHQLLHALQA